MHVGKGIAGIALLHLTLRFDEAEVAKRQQLDLGCRTPRPGAAADAGREQERCAEELRDVRGWGCWCLWYEKPFRFEATDSNW